jgi:hypothetical protein
MRRAKDICPGDRRLPAGDQGATGELYGGWPMILSGLKTLPETGESLTTPGSLRYAGA